MDLQAIEARLAAATQGQWDVDTIPETGESRVVVRSNTGDPMLDVSVATHGVRAEDAEFIAHAPKDIKALIEEVKLLRWRIERVKKEHAEKWVNDPPPGGAICDVDWEPVESDPCTTVLILEGRYDDER